VADSRAKTPAPEGFVGVDDLVEIYGWKKSWVYKQVQARTIPSYKLGHYVQFRLSEVEDWVASRKVEPSYG
jgi:excisionase family DNA binding protein